MRVGRHTRHARASEEDGRAVVEACVAAEAVEGCWGPQPRGVLPRRR